MAKLTSNEVLRIQQRFSMGETISSLSREYGVNKNTIKRALGVTEFKETKRVTVRKVYNEK